jgi:putative endonuclease
MHILKIKTEKRLLGDLGERAARRFLRRTGHRIVKKNFVADSHEIDIIAEDKETLIFVEVKTRRQDKNNLMRPADAVNNEKRTNLLKFAYAFCKTLPAKLKNKTPRIDVCEVYAVQEKNKLKVCEFNYIENAVTKEQNPTFRPSL